MAGKPPKKPAKIAQEIEAAMRMHLAGQTYSVIAEELGMSKGTVHNRIQAGIKMVVTPAAEEVRKVEIARLDKYLVALDRRIELGDDKAINAALRVSERRARLLGLDAPVQVEITQPDSIEAEIARLEAELGASTPTDH